MAKSKHWESPYRGTAAWQGVAVIGGNPRNFSGCTVSLPLRRSAADAACANNVDGDVGLFGAAHDLSQRGFASAVLRFTDNQHNAAPFHRLGLQEAYGGGHSVVEIHFRTIEFRAFDRFFDGVAILSERLTHGNRRIVGEDGSFAIESHDCIGEDDAKAVDRRGERMQLRVGVDDESDGQGIAAKFPAIDLLLDAVVENMEVILREVENEFAATSGDGYRHGDLGGGDVNGILRRRGPGLRLGLRQISEH